MNPFQERATWYDRARDLARLGRVEIPPRDNVDWLWDHLGDDAVDLRHLVDDKGRGKEHGTFEPEGATVHQTGFAWPDDKPDERYQEIPAHFVIRQSGRVLLLHDLRALMYHGHALNRRSIGIEVECREYGTGSSFWRSRKEKRAGRTKAELHRPVTEAQIASLATVITWAEFELDRVDNFPIWGHRQGHRSRVTDPGPAIFRRLHPDDIRPNDTFGSGTRIPESWYA